MLNSPVLLATQMQKIRAILPASTLTGILWPGSCARLCPQVKVQHASGNRLCSNDGSHGSNFKGLILEAQRKFLKASSPKRYKTFGGTDILPDSLLKAERPSQLFLLHHLKNGTTVLHIPGMELFNEIVHFNKFPQEKPVEKRMLLVYAFEIYVSHWNKY